MPTKIYLAGPMRGYREFNFPAFREQRKRLLDAGYHVFCPAERDEQEGFDPTGMKGTTTEELLDARFNLREALAADLGWILSSAQGVAVLPGWENSSGATAEVALARALGLPVARVECWIHYDYWATGMISTEQDAATVVEAEATMAPVTNINTRVFIGRDDEWEEIPGVKIVDITSEEVVDDNEFVGAEIIDKGWTGTPVDAEEVRVTDPDTGGQKGTKPERYDLIPVQPLAEVARHYGAGAAKYDDNNWRRGYRWSLSYAALQRHANLFWAGESNDPEMGTHHLAAVAFHAFTLMQFEADALGTDDRGEVTR